MSFKILDSVINLSEKVRKLAWYAATPIFLGKMLPYYVLAVVNEFVDECKE